MRGFIMFDRKIRNKRMQELIQKSKDKVKQEERLRLKESIELEYPNAEVLFGVESEKIYNDLQDKFPFVWWGRIDWENFENKIEIINLADIMDSLIARCQSEDYKVFILYGYSTGEPYVIKTDLQNVLRHIEKNSVGDDQWIYCPTKKFVIEFYHEGDIVIGFGS
jgi:hypothetical protein